MQVINIGAAPDDHTGDKLRDAFDKCNANFSLLLAAIQGGLEIITYTPAPGDSGDVIIKMNTAGLDMPVNIVAANDASARTTVIIKDQADESDGVISVTPASGTIDGEATYPISITKEFIRITPNAAQNNWYITGR